MSGAEAIAALGDTLGPDILAAVQSLYREPQEALAGGQPPAAIDQAYGSDPRQRLDLYAPEGAAGAPILLWVHGGGFLRGDKGGDADPFNAHVGRWAARNGMVGAVINYRLAPDHGWPAGGEDVGLALDWLRSHAPAFGGDPRRIVLMGTSAGAVHVATHLKLRPDTPARAAVLMSGLYGFTPLDARDTLYYGPPELYPQRWPREAVVAAGLPLLIVGAEYDPPRFRTEMTELLAARPATSSHLATGHNHFSLPMHLGTADTRLADQLIAFIEEHIA